MWFVCSISCPCAQIRVQTRNPSIDFHSHNHVFLHCIMSESPIELKVKIQDGDNIVVNCLPSDTIESLKKQIENQSFVPINEQKLIYRGRVLADEKTLTECSIGDHCAIILVRQKVSGCYSLFTRSQDKRILLPKRNPKRLQRQMFAV